MLKNVTENWILVIGFITLCGFLYQIAYWSQFNLNGISYINLTDVIKGAVQPFTENLLIFAISLLALFVTEYFKSEERSFTDFLIIFCVQIVVAILSHYYLNYILPYSFIISLVIEILIFKYANLPEYLTNKAYKKWFLFVLIYLPLLSYFSGVENAQTIKLNKNYSYIICSESLNKYVKKYSRLKYLGSTDKEHIFSSLNNKSLFMFKIEKVDTLILYYQKQYE